MRTKRLYYAIKQAQLGREGATNSQFRTVYGLQDASVSTNFSLTQIYEFGQLEVYDQIEDLPDVQATMNKIIDGHPLIWHLATIDAANPTLAGRSVPKTVLRMSMFPDSNESATGAADNVLECSGMYPQSISYTFGLDGAFTEAVTLVGNDKIYRNDGRIVNAVASGRQANLFNVSGQFNAIHSPSTVSGAAGIETRKNLSFEYTPGSLDVNNQLADEDGTILPPDIDGISSSGTNNRHANGDYKAIIQNITVSTDLGRESINALGKRGPYHRYATFPTEVTCSIEALSLSGDNISATEEGIYNTSSSCTGINSNLKNSTIRIATCGGLRIYLGTKNRLQSVDFGGGTTDGGNDTNTYNFVTFNKMTVMAQYDPHPSGSTWWSDRTTYLVG